jgi:hypothetical protein
MNTAELKYGITSTYKHKLDEERMAWLTNRTRRSVGQTLFLFQLVDGDFEKLKRLETQIKNCHFSGSPIDKETVDEVLSMQPKSVWFNL